MVRAQQGDIVLLVLSKANTNYLDTGLKILDLCHKASFPATELSAEEVAQIIREVYLNATIKNKKVTVIFREPFYN